MPSDDGKRLSNPSQRGDSASARSDSPCSVESTGVSGAGLGQQHGDMTAEKTKQQQTQQNSMEPPAARPLSQDAVSMGKSPGEVAFFKLLHAELKKAIHFFERATDEFSIREERVREGMRIMKQPNSIMVSEKWSLMAKSIYRLYRDLLLLETFAIMAYCSFSKILKKHDKVTGYETRTAFMTNVVNKANFTHYPKVLEMINRCERLYEEVSDNLLREGKEGLYEDERLFINMIHRLNEQVLGSEDSKVHAERQDPPRRIVAHMPPSNKESQATSTLRTLVEENMNKERPNQVSEGQTGATKSEETRVSWKRQGTDGIREPSTKRHREG